MITNTRQLHISNAFKESRQCDKKLNYFYSTLRKKYVWLSFSLYIISSCMSFAKNYLCLNFQNIAKRFEREKKVCISTPVPTSACWLDNWMARMLATKLRKISVVSTNFWRVNAHSEVSGSPYWRPAGDTTIQICSNSSFSKRSLGETLLPISADERWQILGISSWSKIIWKDTKIEVVDKSRLWFRWCPKWWLFQNSEISRTIKREIEKVPIDNLELDENSREVATYVAGL